MENIFSKLTKSFLILILLTPLLVLTNLLFPFITSKAFCFNLLIELTIISFACLIYFNRKYLSLPKRNWILFIFFGYLLIKIISDLFGFSFFKSFWGNFERMMGLFTWLHFLIFLILLITLFRRKKDYILLFDISIIVSLLVSLYALLQKAGVSFVLDSGWRLQSTIGNAAFLAAYLIFNIFFALYLLLKKDKLSWRIYYALAIVLQAIILFFTATRGGILGLVAGFGLFLLLGLWLSQSKKLKISLLAIIIFLLAVSGVFYLSRDSSFVQNIESLRRIANISFEDSTVKSRLLLWQLSPKAWQDRPLLGWGENNINLAIDKYYQEEIREDWFDSTHNIFFDNLISHGLLGLFFYLGLIFSLFLYLFKQRKKNQKEFIVFVPLLAAYLFQNFFLFDTHTSLIMFLLTISFIVVNFNLNADNNKKPDRKGYSVFILFILIILALGSIFLNIKAVRSAYYVAESRRYSIINTQKGMLLYNQAIDNTYYGYENIANLGADWLKDIFNKRIEFLGNVNDLVILTRKVMNKGISRDPLYSKNYLVMAKIYQLARNYDEKYLDESISLLEKAQLLSPNRLAIYNGLAQAYFYKNDFEQSIDYLKQGMIYDPYIGRSYYNLGVMQLLARKIEEGKESIALASGQGYQFLIDDYLRLVNIYIDLKDYPEAINCYKKAIEINPDRTDFYTGIAAIYKEMGNKEKAREFALKILEIDPQMKEAIEAFLKNL
ncbi:MAG: O-antigen ligase family protein [Candidatus Portnoybacteria bacterium]|nr:O-antigen ligase family protein [Candidatus Portnoybacteria bacterium]